MSLAKRPACDMREASPTPHPDTLRLDKLARIIEGGRDYMAFADYVLTAVNVTPDDLRAYIDGLED